MGFFCLFILIVKVLVSKRILGAAGDEPGPEKKYKRFLLPRPSHQETDFLFFILDVKDLIGFTGNSVKRRYRHQKT